MSKYNEYKRAAQMLEKILRTMTAPENTLDTFENLPGYPRNFSISIEAAKADRVGKFELRSYCDKLSQDDAEFVIDYIAAVEFNHREQYAQAREAKERGISTNDLIENDDGRLSEILNKLGIEYGALRAMYWDSIVARHESLSGKKI